MTKYIQMYYYFRLAYMQNLTNFCRLVFTGHLRTRTRGTVMDKVGAHLSQRDLRDAVWFLVRMSNWQGTVCASPKMCYSICSFIQNRILVVIKFHARLSDT